ncbi:autophagy protein 5 isoform X2 [Cryptomeria japonica]|uniref:autophagy protein 5 isoform X2 n=1 Tax=Cryptomeria japonica TaxID=3369 RepID=UPI0027DA47E1|nr:autophagy protein 5 isoform X2 [Cryptomeria japonica]
MENWEARSKVWEGSIPIQLHLHHSQVTTLPPPPPLMVLGPRNGYLPLLVPLIKPHFQSSLPPGTDTVWFDYKGLPLKWYIPTGVLFDLLCAEPERPWNITVHFRGYPSDILSPCEGEDNLKWNFINSLKEASYIINGSIKNVMNMPQSEQMELWRCVVKGDLEGYCRASARLRPGGIAEDATRKAVSHRQNHNENDTFGTSRIPVHLYLRDLRKEVEDFADALPVESWDEINYINRPVEIPKDDGSKFTLGSALASLLPELFPNYLLGEESKGLADSCRQLTNSDLEVMTKSGGIVTSQVGSGSNNALPSSDSFDSETGPVIINLQTTKDSKQVAELQKASSRWNVKIIRVQGIELPDLDLPFNWVAQNLVAPEHFLHICIYTLKVGNEEKSH